MLNSPHPIGDNSFTLSLCLFLVRCNCSNTSLLVNKLLSSTSSRNLFCIFLKLKKTPGLLFPTPTSLTEDITSPYRPQLACSLKSSWLQHQTTRLGYQNVVHDTFKVNCIRKREYFKMQVGKKNSSPSQCISTYQALLIES